MPDKDWAIIVVLGIGWGTSFFFNEILLRELGPIAVSFARISMAAVFCWIWLIAKRSRALVPQSFYPQFAILGLLMFAFPFAIYPIGQQYVASGVAGIVNALTPVMVVVVSHFWPGGERATILKSLGVLAGFLGIVLLTLRALSADDSSLLFGTLLIMLAPVSYALAMNYVRRLLHLDVSVVLAWSFTFAAVLLLPVMLWNEGFPAAISSVSWGAIVFLGSVLTGRRSWLRSIFCHVPVRQRPRR